MEIEKIYRLSLKIIASIFLAASLLHLVWNQLFSTYTEMKGLTEIQRDMIYLLNLSIALYHFTFSILLFGISSMTSLTLNQLRAFSALILVFWMFRLLLEFIFPVQVPFVILPDPSISLKILMVTQIIILALPEILLRAGKKAG
ncbi:MAG TPA: hypothetical protein VIO58_13395 [Candidatus Methanoperedens sp.]